MSVLGFDIRDYTDPQRILEESIRAPFGTVVSPQPTAAPATPAPAPSVPPATAPVTIDQGTGAVVNGPPGINPTATEQPPAVPIPGTAGPSGVSVSTPASISPMEGVTNQDRLNAMAMVLGAVGQNNFSQVLGAAQAGLMQKDQKAREHNQKLAGLTTPQLDYDPVTGLYDYEPPKWEIDSKGNYVPRSLADIEADYKKFYGDKKSARPIGETYTNENGVVISKTTNLPVNPELAELHAKRGGLTAEEAARDYKEAMATHQELKGHYMNLATSLTDPDNPYADVASIFGFMKMLDPRSVVRDGEFDKLQNTGSVPNNIFNIFEKASTGGILNQSQQKQLLDYVNKVYDSNKMAADEILNANRQLFDELQFDQSHLQRFNPYSDSLQELRTRAGEFSPAPTPASTDVTLTVEEQALAEAAIAEQLAEEEAIRRGTNSGTYTGNPRVPR